MTPRLGQDTRYCSTGCGNASEEGGKRALKRKARETVGADVKTVKRRVTNIFD